MAGSFDLFHMGHVKLLEEARKLGTFVYVGVYDDKTAALCARLAAARLPSVALADGMMTAAQCGGQWLPCYGH